MSTVTTAPPVGAHAKGSRGSHPRSRWWALAVIGLAQLMVVLDATIVNIALPSAQQDLGFSNDSRQWIITAYSLAFGSLLLLGGRLADLFGRRNTFLIGIIGFGVVSAIGGAADGFTMLVISRALQGMFGALLAPSAMSLLTTTFTDPRERGRAFGVFGAIAGSGGAIGLLLGGVLTEHLDWRWTMYVNVVIAVLAVLGTLAFVRGKAPRQRPKLDLIGTIIVAAGLFSIVFGFSNAETYDWGDPLCWLFLAAGVVLLAGFAFWETRSEHPLLPLRVLADRNRAASYLSVFISGAGMFGVFLFLTYYLQTTLGYTPIQTGLGFLPMVGGLMLMAQVSTNLLIPKLGPKPTVPLGMAAAGAGLIWLTALDANSGYAGDVLPPLLMLGLGLGMIMPVAMSLATLGVAASDQGVASATVNTMQQIGGSIGTALFNTVAASAAVDYATEHRGDADVAVQSSLHSYSTAYWWAAGFFAVGLVLALVLYRRGRPFSRGSTAPEETEPIEDAPIGGEAREPAVVAAGAPSQHADGVSVHGTVVTARGVPVGGAVVTLITRDGRQIDRTTSGGDGRYAVLAPVRGSYVLFAASPGQEPQAHPLTVGTLPYPIDLVLSTPFGRVRGVVSAGADPVPDAVAVATDDTGTVHGSVRTDGSGGYLLDGLVPGAYTLTFTAPGHEPAASAAVLAAGEDVAVDVQLRRSTTLRGTVHTSGGHPLPEAQVALLDAEGTVVDTQTTAGDGGYVFADLPHGSYTVVASGYAPTTAQVALADGGDELHLTLGRQ